MIGQHERMKFALAMLIRNLEGQDLIDSLKPISPDLAAQMAEVARAAYFHEPHERLDQAIEQNDTENGDASQ